MDLLSLSSPLNPSSLSSLLLKPKPKPSFAFPNPKPSFSSFTPTPRLFSSSSSSSSSKFKTIPIPKCLQLSAPQTPGTAMRGAEADVMGLLLKERIVFLGSEIQDFVADAIISQLLLLDAQDPTKDIKLFINSTGGSLSATLAIFDVLRLVRADVSTVALGISASTAAIILGGGTKGKRFAMPNTRIMIHQPLGGTSGQALDVEIQAQEIMHSKDNVIRIISDFTGRTYEQVEKDIDRDRFMSPIEGVEYGIIDGVIDRDSIIPLFPLPEKVESTFDFVEVVENPEKYFTPDVPDDEIY